MLNALLGHLIIARLLTAGATGTAVHSKFDAVAAVTRCLRLYAWATNTLRCLLVTRHHGLPLF